MKKEKEDNSFKCACCGKERQRGHYIKIRDGKREGEIVKVCMSSDCTISAHHGIFPRKAG